MASDPKRVQALFLEAVELPVADRSVFLDRECDADVELRQRVDALLEAHDQPGSFLDRPAQGPVSTREEQSGAEMADASERTPLAEKAARSPSRGGEH
jgi:hypothetical protein